MTSGRVVEVARYSTGHLDLTGIDEETGQRAPLDATQVSDWLGTNAQDADRLIHGAARTGHPEIITADITSEAGGEQPRPTSDNEARDERIAGPDLATSDDEVALGEQDEEATAVDAPVFIDMAGSEAAEAFTHIAERDANLASDIAAHTETTLTDDALADAAREDALTARTALNLASTVVPSPGRPASASIPPQVNAAITTALSATAHSHDEVLTSLERSAEHADILDVLERAQAKKTSRPHRRGDRYDYPAVHSLTEGPLIQQQ